MADPVAWYAAVVATVAAMAQVVNTIRDRSAVRVKAHQSVVPGERPGDDGRRLGITVVNRGRRPVTIVAAGLILREPRSEGKTVDFLWGLKPGGNRLDEGESATFLWRPDSETLPLFKCAWARDATGRVYRGPCVWQ